MARLSKRGITLVEILIAVVIIGVALISLGLVFSEGVVLMTETRERNIANQCIQEMAESIRDMSYDEILALGPTFNASGFPQLQNPQGLLDIEDTFGQDDIRRVTITLNWNSSIGRPLTRRLATYVTREGINKE